ncbi:MAG TPA: DUF5658 family protein [Candidatus Dormibacteraeota bacterium]
MASRTQILADSRLCQLLTLTGFLGFQLMDAVTTHVGLISDHAELNRIMAPIIAGDGELVAYAVKGTAVAVLLALLMLGSRRVPQIWHVYQVAAILTAMAVVANLLQLI